MFYNIRINPCNLLTYTELDEHPFLGVTIPLMGQSPEMGLKTALKWMWVLLRININKKPPALKPGAMGHFTNLKS
jgi:hypothetical protein